MIHHPQKMSIPATVALSFLVFVFGTITGFIGGLACDENIPETREKICGYAGSGSSLAVLAFVPPIAMLIIGMSATRRVAGVAAGIILAIEVMILVAVLTVGV